MRKTSCSKSRRRSAVGSYYRVLLMVLRHLVHTAMRRGLPSTMIVARWTLTFQRRFVWRMEWLTLCPNWGPRPQT